eukprot:comp22495_c0_seq1/m.33973 comp22495_c0_seq1/g.33973  ORF comp22495_c0_seq1/g.33973 comp22495_c0_seq1/m.33973 type:complete len:541 (-) comp22495_c0_seq1:591-2213(-)
MVGVMVKMSADVDGETHTTTCTNIIASSPAGEDAGTKPLPHKYRRVLILAAAAVLLAAVATAIAVPVVLFSQSSDATTNQQQAEQTIYGQTTKVGNFPAKAVQTTRNAPATPAGPTAIATSGAFEPCTCAVIATNQSCYPDLQSAVAIADPGSVIYVLNSTTVTNEISIANSLTFRSLDCSAKTGVKGQKPTIFSSMNMKAGGIFRVSGDKTRISLEGLNFRRKEGSGFSSVIRTKELGTDYVIEKYPATPESTDLYVKDCNFSGFRVDARGGSVFWIEKAGNIEIRNSKFTKNRVDTESYEMYDGSGAVWVRFVPEDANINVDNCEFAQNEHTFWHGEGSAFGGNIVSGTIRITNSRFINNRCQSGGAMFWEMIEKTGNLVVDKTEFRGNSVELRPHVVTGEFEGARGGAIWLKWIKGTVNINGDFIENSCHGDRAGAIANNRLLQGGRVTISGKFEGNTADKGAAVWDTMQGWSDNAILTVEESTEFSGNRGLTGEDLLIRLMAPETKTKLDDDPTLMRTNDGFLYESGWKKRKMVFV